MAEYAFSIGSMVLKQATVTKKTIAYAKNIAIDQKVSTTKQYGPDGTTVIETVDTEETIITADFVEKAWDTTLVVGASYDLELLPGALNTGIALTLTTCKLTGYTVRESHADYVLGSLVFSKLGTITGGGTPLVEQAQFGSIYLGDSATVNSSFEGNMTSIIIPRALGALIRSTYQNGGGVSRITIEATKNDVNSFLLEQYWLGLVSQLSPSTATITVTYNTTSYTLTNCRLVSFSTGEIKAKSSKATFEFIRSAY